MYVNGLSSVGAYFWGPIEKQWGNKTKKPSLPENSYKYDFEMQSKRATTSPSTSDGCQHSGTMLELIRHLGMNDLSTETDRSEKEDKANYV